MQCFRVGSQFTGEGRGTGSVLRVTGEREKTPLLTGTNNNKNETAVAEGNYDEKKMTITALATLSSPRAAEVVAGASEVRRVELHGTRAA